ncbi:MULTISPECIES: hypothetical protein [Rhodococcus]|uniref:hypothetical protein n=1 Tax=Rhodococcus TaxID=1827 RepID=UPI001877866C|nr:MULTISPECIES: hypothetical protein [Rhodococcus]MDI9960789.1 hypothetical protein [Rhodococcus sp. IEGM 1237]MDI9966809.1 hypothetical protein [Rhodococcus sp. IEGM 1251]MDV8129265.1 hypothetical protein [Rhodococcus sp. IEGM 1304]QOS60652.1 hypothetical protein IM699_14445 [Rhodococcus qingshengii]
MSKNTRRTGTIAALVGAAALIAPAFANAAPTGSLGSADPGAGFSCSATSTETTANGWGIPFTDEKDQTASYSAENVFDKDGSLKLEVTDVTDRSVSYHAAGSIKLADAAAKEIGFSERAVTTSAAFQLRLTGTTNPADNGFTTLVWVPSQNDAPVTTDAVKHENIQDGLWWSTRTIGGAAKGVPTSLDAIVAANPDAKVEHYGVSVGTGSAASSVFVDAVKLNGCTTNFAKKDADPETGTGSLGNIFGSLS